MNLLKYRAPTFTTAQLVLMACGVDDLRLQSHHHDGGNKHHSKSGPGRCHAQGKGDHPNAKVKAPTVGLVPRHEASAAKRLRRSLVKLSGIRQHKRHQRAAKALPLGLVG